METVVDLKRLAFQNGVCKSYQLAQWVFVKAGWHSCLTDDMECERTADYGEGRLNLEDATGVDSQLAVGAAQHDLVQQADY